jgi:alkaline phosphatase D
MPGYRKLLRACPVFATWDDNDFGRNDAGADYAKRDESQQVFLEFFKEPVDSPRRKRPGVYDARVFGPPGKRVQVILLDTRYFRGPLTRRDATSGPYVANTDPAATMLGEAQWRWLEEQFRAPAEVRIIASSIQVVPEDHGSEKWMNMPRERERLYRLIRDTRAAGVIFLSGDRHLAELSMMDGGVGYPLYDLTSSGLNAGSKTWRAYEVNRHRVGTMNWGDNFGMVQIDWERDDPQIRLQSRDADGDIAIQRKINLSTLQPGTIKP